MPRLRIASSLPSTMPTISPAAQCSQLTIPTMKQNMIKVDFAVEVRLASRMSPAFTSFESATTKPVIIITVNCIANVSNTQKPFA